MLKKIFFTTVLSGIFFMNLVMVQAQTNSSTGFIPKATGNTATNCKAPANSGLDDATYCGDYKLEDFTALAILASNWILGIVGSLSLIMFVYGGVMFLISAGSSDKVGQAKKIIIAAVIGLIIVFSSYLIIKFVVEGIGAKDIYKLGDTSTTVN